MVEIKVVKRLISYIKTLRVRLVTLECVFNIYKIIIEYIVMEYNIC